MGTRSDKLFPFKSVTVTKAMDAEDNQIPLKLGYLFKNGMAGTDNDANGADDNIDMAAKLGYKLGKNIGGPDHPDYNPATDPSPIAYWKVETEFFNLDHAITKENALRCYDCHNTSDSVLDWDALGISNPFPIDD